MKKLRAFLAVPISAELRNAISKQVQQLATVSPAVRWTDPDGLHITLKFFGEIEELETVEISRCVQRVTAEHAAFEVDVAGFGAFPAIDRPRTLWAGIQQGSDQLSALQADLENALSDLGYKAETRRYHPHVTIGRVRDKVGMSDLSSALERLADEPLGIAAVEDIVFYSSELRRSGAIYTPLATSPLK